MRIYLGDLGHYTVKLTNNHTPINIGFIAGYVKLHMGDAVDVHLFKHPDRLMEAISENPPELLGLSNYVWCQSISELVLRFYKRLKPDGIALWGGPNFPMNELHKAKQYLLARPYVDFYVPFEGETPTFNIVRTFYQTHRRLSELKSEHREHPEYFEGAFFITEEGELIGNNIGIQIKDLNTIPSPYLEGWMDPFLREGLHPMFETQRGCPYHCSFCHTGLKYYDKGRSFALGRLKKEIEYVTAMVPDPTKAHLYITDSNFGMWPQDLELTHWLREHYEKTGFPLSFGTSTGKGRAELVLKTVLSHPKLMLTNSVQSLDDKVLKEIHRRNFPIEQLMHTQAEIDKDGKISQPEMILGLPLETRESHLNTFRNLISQIGATIIYQYTLMLLPGTEIYTDEARQKYGYQVRYRVLPTSYGDYWGERCFEIEEVSVATNHLSFDEYLEMREVYFFVHNVHSNAIYKPLLRYLLYLGDDVIDFFLYLMQKRRAMGTDTFPNDVIDAYVQETQDELFETREQLVACFSDDQNWEALVRGEKGRNLSHTYRAIMLLHAREWAEFVTQYFREYLQEKHEYVGEVEKMSESLIQHTLIQAECQKRYFGDHARIPGERNPLQVELDYDVAEIFKTIVRKEELPSLKEEKIVYSYFMRDDAIRYITSFLEQQRLVDWALIILRMDHSYFIPVCQRSEEAVLVA